MLGLDNGVDQQRQPGGDRRRPGKVEVPCGRSWRLSVRAARASHAAASASGALRNNTHRQPGPPVSTPPSRAPAGTPTEDTADQMARARSRADPSARSRSAEPAPPARSAPPPSPWPARAATSTPADGARPHANDPTANTTSPAMNTRRRPTRSAARPPSNKNPTKGQQIAVHDPLQAGLAEPPRSRWIDGRATLTISPSSTTRKSAAASTRSANMARRLRDPHHSRRPHPYPVEDHPPGRW